MKIALIGSTSNSFIRFREGLIKTLVNLGLEVYVLCNDYDATTYQKVLDLKGIPVSYKMNRSGLNPFTDILQTYQLTKILSELQCDIVCSFFAKPSIYGTLAAKIAGVPKIFAMLEGLGTTFTQTPQTRSKQRFIKFFQLLLYRMSYRFLDTLFVLNPDDRHELVEKARLPIKDCKVLGGIGLNLQDFPLSPAPIEPLRFLFVGRLLKEKGIQEYIEAALAVKKKYPNVTFTVIGSLDKDNPSSLSKKDLENIRAMPEIEYVGQVSNILEWLQKTSVFVLPSYREGVPRSTQEAMAVGRAVITTDVPGCRETVTEGLNGFLVPPFSVVALMEKMIYFIEHPDRIQQMGEQSHLIAQNKFDEQTINQQLIAWLDLPQ